MVSWCRGSAVHRMETTAKASADLSSQVDKLRQSGKQINSKCLVKFVRSVRTCTHWYNLLIRRNGPKCEHRCTDTKLASLAPSRLPGQRIAMIAFRRTYFCLSFHKGYESRRAILYWQNAIIMIMTIKQTMSISWTFLSEPYGYFIVLLMSTINYFFFSASFGNKTALTTKTLCEFLLEMNWLLKQSWHRHLAYDALLVLT